MPLATLANSTDRYLFDQSLMNIDDPYKYAAFVARNEEWQQAMNALRAFNHPVVAEVGRNFQAGMMRLALAGVAPAELSWITAYETLLICRAHQKVHGSRPMTCNDLLDENRSVAEKEEQLRLYNDGSVRPGTRDEYVWKIGINNVARHSEWATGMAVSINALYVSAILEAWIYFEALAGDLWTKAVDAGGAEISKRVFLEREWDKPVKSSAVLHCKHSPKEKPGSFLREVEVVSFQKKRLIVQNFVKAFGDELKQVFDSDKYIWALSAFRNCITHSAGKADAAFIEQVAPHQEFRSIKLNDELFLDGETAARLVRAALNTAVALLGKIDEILQRGD